MNDQSPWLRLLSQDTSRRSRVDRPGPGRDVEPSHQRRQVRSLASPTSRTADVQAQQGLLAVRDEADRIVCERIVTPNHLLTREYR